MVAAYGTIVYKVIKDLIDQIVKRGSGSGPGPQLVDVTGLTAPPHDNYKVYHLCPDKARHPRMARSDLISDRIEDGWLIMYETITNNKKNTYRFWSKVTFANTSIFVSKRTYCFYFSSQGNLCLILLYLNNMVSNLSWSNIFLYIYIALFVSLGFMLYSNITLSTVSLRL